MRKILRSDAVCLRCQDYQESSKLVTLFTREHGRVGCIAKGARRLKSKFGAALDVCAVSRVIYYWRETSSLYTLSDAELLEALPGLAETPERFLAAEQMTEFILRTTQPADPHPDLFELLVTYLRVLNSAPPDAAYPGLVASFLLKAASFLGFRPELRRCLVCRKPLADVAVYFDPGRGGTVCASCAGEYTQLTKLAPDAFGALTRLLYTPVADLAREPARADQLDLVVEFVSHHFDPVVLRSFRWPKGL